ncbi:hypothetical protein [Clostridium saccharoperbutylacetonicum]|uniref:hypothetical protein n=1 Tax=Clostridium saccharoperbutylacetonicum TaxID=36745 RepID=UPI0039EBDE2C
MSIYEVNNNPTIEKIVKYDEDRQIFYRFQMKDWEMGTQSWGMIYSSAEEAIECCEDNGLTPETAVLDGKCACDTANELAGFSMSFDKDFRVLVLSGDCVDEGHDGESVVDVAEILEIWDFDEFFEVFNSMCEDEE